QTTEATGGWSTFATHTINDVALEEGTQVITLHFVGDVSFNISSITFSKTGDANSLDAIALNGELGANESSIQITVNQDLLESSLTDAKDDFSITVNGLAQAISQISLVDAKKRTIQLDVDRSFLSSDEIKVSYDGNSVSTVSGKNLTAFSELLINNNLPVRSLLPGKIQAEDFSEMSGLQTEDTSDDGGGKNIGYTDQGDYADYLVNAEKEGSFIFIARVASESTAGKMGIYLLGEDESETELISLDLPVTGGWQKWENAKGSITIAKGLQTLRMKVLKGGFNLNWMEIAGVDADQDGVPDTEDECPNSNPGVEVNEKGCEVFSVGLDNFKIKVESETCQANNNGKIIVSANKSFTYTANLSGKSTDSKAFSSETEFTDLEAGTYTICFKAAEDAEFEQCFTVQVTEPENLNVYSSIDIEKSMISLKLSGSKTYLITLNGIEYQTSESIFSARLDASKNTLTVKTDNDCQGEYKELINLKGRPTAYPNPVNGDYLFISLVESTLADVQIYIFDVTGKLVISELKKDGKGPLQINVAALPKGLFLLKVIQNNNTFNYKILR
ncbi:carbohydrate-binding protein, partial [Lutimonas sp.]|uniref:carbohydrate-binding protein n=1 Tax=Lutimonas sp. TaxID=1872403 RepID=UPI003C7519A2